MTNNNENSLPQEKKTNKFGKIMKKTLWTIVIVLVLGLGIFGYVRYYYVFGEGVKAGQLNYVVHKGYVFKTYEGKLIQAGFRQPKSGTAGSAAVQSYEFEFSISDKSIADSLSLCSGREVLLSYKEYFSAIPWRGNSKYVVDKIIEVK